MQRIDLYQPMIHTRVSTPPLFINVGINRNGTETVEGPVEGVIKPETYVLLSALPDELKERVKTAIQALLSSM